MRTVPPELAKRYEAEGWWTRDTLGDLLARGLAAAPDTEFRVHSAVRPWSGTFRHVENTARRLAAGLQRRGVGAGDVVAFQLPNWVEAAAVFWASAFLGAVIVPIVHFYGRKEVGYILTAVKPKVFITAQLDHPDFTPDQLKSMKYAGLGGAPVPAAVTERLDKLGITVFRSYGSTEHPSITGSLYTAPRDKRLYTDGNLMEGEEIRLTGEGEILSRGPDLCLGYTDETLTAAAFDEDGWYHTGDIAVVDDDGYLSITDRKSHMIIRGGENISALEVEDLMLGIDGVAEVAVVAAPDKRLGEHAAAVVRMKPAHEKPALDQVRRHLERAGLARQKWPEEIHAVDDFPRTASGKVQKYILRREIAEHQRGE
jgi:acyl-CoA synthetase (AMP-forming)/AMP-acid ligase II